MNKSCGKLVVQKKWDLPDSVGCETRWQPASNTEEPPEQSLTQALSACCLQSVPLPDLTLSDQKKTHCCHPDIISIDAISLLIALCMHLMTGSIKLELCKNPS